MTHTLQLQRMHLFIYGRVQGVSYRASTVLQAQKLNLRGWVRNCPDGSVEVLAEGEAVFLNELLQWCHQGPPRARVDQVKVDFLEYQGDFGAFEMISY